MTDTSRISLRLATRVDTGFILQCIRELADYEHALDEVRGTISQLEQWLFDTPVAECLIASLDNVDRGIALFFTNFSTWETQPGFFLEDLYVQHQARKHGLGLALLKELARLALERGYTRLDWNCYDWNEPSLAFYRALGATARSEWIPHRLSLEAMGALVAGKPMSTGASVGASAHATADAPMQTEEL